MYRFESNDLALRVHARVGGVSAGQAVKKVVCAAILLHDHDHMLDLSLGKGWHNRSQQQKSHRKWLHKVSIHHCLAIRFALTTYCSNKWTQRGVLATTSTD